MNRIRQIVKRDGRTVPFELDKISDAIFKAAQVLGGRDKEMSRELANDVQDYLLEVCHNTIPTVEQIQDAVEKVLIEAGHARTAKEFILYRAERTRVRDMNTKLMRIYEDLTFKEAKIDNFILDNITSQNHTESEGMPLILGDAEIKNVYASNLYEDGKKVDFK